jgi:eukaryotic-like serine/threonine-protein kinase
LWRIAAGGGEPTLLAGGGAKLKHPSVARRTGVVAYEDWQYEINLREQATDADEGAESSTAVSATSDRWNFHPQISPDGRRLVFQSTRSGQYELWLAARDGSGARPLTRSAAYKSPARWSPDSRSLVFTSRSGRRTDVSILDVENGSIRTVASDATSAVAPSWSSDGNAVYVGSLRSGSWQIWRVDAGTGNARQITTDGGYAALESADGRWLYVARLDRPGLWRHAVDGGTDVTLAAEGVLAEQWPNWGLLERGVYLVTWPGDGDPQLVATTDATGAPRTLARLPQFAWYGVAVPRDGSRVIYARADRRASNIGSLSYTGTR